ncbi:Wnt oncogene analog 4 [Carabus blaptoides fortunei]
MCVDGVSRVIYRHEPRDMRATPTPLRALALVATLLVLVLATGQRNKIQHELKSIQMIMKSMYMSPSTIQKTTPCGWLKKFKRQYRLCKNDPGIADTLQSAKQLAISHCEELFRYNRWNCSRPKKYFRAIFRETALLYAMISSALTFTVARACADGKLYNCHCAKDHDPKSDVVAWKWGLCGDNIKYGKKFTKQFLQLNQKGDELQSIMRHNSIIGVNIVTNKRFCTCHGFPKPCKLRICPKQLEPFEKFAIILKNRYHSALMSEIGNSAHNKRYKGGKNDSLIYLAKSPTFCKSTPGRRCLNADNCATLCCGRGYATSTVLHKERCKCHWKKSCCTEIKCDNCTYYQDEYICK